LRLPTRQEKKAWALTVWPDHDLFDAEIAWIDKHLTVE